MGMDELKRIETQEFIIADNSSRERRRINRMRENKTSAYTHQAHDDDSFMYDGDDNLKGLFRELRGRRREPGGKGDGDQDVRSILVRLGICAVICLAVFLLKSVDSPFANDVVGGVRTALTFDLDASETIGKLKFVQDDTEAQDVMAEYSSGMVLPIEGVIVGIFGQNGGESLDMIASEDTYVVAAADGVVRDVVSGDGSSVVTLEHAGGIRSIYTFEGDAEVEAGGEITQGSIIGRLMQGQKSSFEVMEDGIRVDPAIYLGMSFSDSSETSSELYGIEK